MNQSIALRKPRLSVRAQTLAALCAIAAAVVLPQLVHLLGAAAGLGSALGEALLPMHLSILLVGLLAGPYAGAAAGLLSPLVSFALTEMPRAALLPFMVLELGVYGLCTGLLRNARMPVIFKLLIAQLAGRAVRAGAILIAVYGFGSQALPVSVIWTSVVTGLLGLVLQWALLPLIVYRVENAANR